MYYYPFREYVCMYIHNHVLGPFPHSTARFLSTFSFLILPTNPHAHAYDAPVVCDGALNRH